MKCEGYCETNYANDVGDSEHNLIEKLKIRRSDIGTRRLVNQCFSLSLHLQGIDATGECE